jgi:hypothetical protein
MAKKVEWYLAVRNEPDLPARVFDMLRYDACFPISNAPDGWVVFRQPYREGHRGGFTVARWASFGFRHLVAVEGQKGEPSFPDALRKKMEDADRQRMAPLGKMAPV